MTNKEKEVLDLVNERVVFMLNNNVDRSYIAKCIDCFIAELPNDYSKEVLSILYRIQDNLLLHLGDYK
jgi:hypothetical protein